MNIQTLFFGMSKDLAGTSSESIEIETGATVEMFRRFLSQKYPSFSEMDSFAIAVNESYADEDVELSDKDTVAIIPPVSGG